MNKISILLAITFLFFSCKEKNIKPAINSELSFYIEKFIDEGVKRGVDLSNEDLEAYLVDEFSREEANGFCGFGWSFYPGLEVPRIEILNTENCWTSRTDVEKENFVFHELGHALARRLHRNEKLPNGITPKSLMCGDWTCSNYKVFLEEGPLRDYYLDELFDEESIFPHTSDNKQFGKILLQDDFEKNDWEAFNTNNDGNPNQYLVYTDSVISNNDTSYSLAITNQETISDSAGIYIIKRFDLTNFNDCSNLIARANIRTEGLVDGYFSMSISLRERDSNGDLHRFFIERKIQDTFPSINNIFEDFESEMYCIPLRTDVVTISIRVHASTPATVFVDDIVIELWE